jgi:succinate dehydrogenase/fumarate reductase flavoprotein subunit
MDADVIVIGSGGAGLMSAIAAADEGANVVQIEKAAELGGTFLISQGTSVGAGTKLQFEQGIYDDSPYNFYQDCMKESRAREVCDPEGMWFYCENARFAVDWLDSLGAYNVGERQCIEPIYGEIWSKARVFRCDSAMSYLRVLLAEHEKRVKRGDITVLLNTRVTGLLKEGRDIVGVSTSGPDGSRDYRAAATVICSGGFTGNVDLMRRYQFPGARDIISAALPDATGECMVMCDEIGAKLVNMDQELLPYIGGISDPENPGRAIAHVDMDGYPGAIWVDNHGNRITNETAGQYLPEPRLAALKAPEMVVNIILDQKIRGENNSTLTWWLGDVPARSWEWFDEKANEGIVIKKADTITELGSALGIDGVALERTVSRWNSHVAAGRDSDFGRSDLTYGIEHPPFYGMTTVPSIIISAGGPAVNVRQQVIARDGSIIPGLYAAGEVTGYRAFGTGGLNTGCIVYGRQAGVQAAYWACSRR